jgi:hypothetical protein
MSGEFLQIAHRSGVDCLFALLLPTCVVPVEAIHLKETTPQSEFGGLKESCSSLIKKWFVIALTSRASVGAMR